MIIFFLLKSNPLEKNGKYIKLYKKKDLRLTSKFLESFKNMPGSPDAAVVVATEHVIVLPLSSGAGRKTNSDTVVFPSADV